MTTATANDYLVNFHQVDVSFGNGTKRKLVLNDIRLRIRLGEFVTIVGPSGCGKSTALNLLLGALFPTKGSVLFLGKPVEGVGRDRGIVYQKYSLFPHITVLENIAVGPILEETNLPQRILHLPAYFRSRRKHFAEAAEFLPKIGFDVSDGFKYPHELSGGMRQRVAIAQALMMKPQILLMDEPFGALDPKTREEMQLLILKWAREYNITVFFVTHDLEEALFLGTRLVGFSQYWSDPTGQPAQGAKIVTDIKLPFTDDPRYKYAPEFNTTLEQVRRDVFDPNHCQPINNFQLTHPDAAPVAVEAVTSGKEA